MRPRSAGGPAGFTYNIGACTESRAGFEQERQWVREFWSALTPWHEGVYVNFLGDEGAQRVQQAYGVEKFAKLQALKQKYDPDNFFHINQNIPPSRAGHQGRRAPAGLRLCSGRRLRVRRSVAELDGGDPLHPPETAAARGHQTDRGPVPRVSGPPSKPVASQSASTSATGKRRR